MSLTPFYAGYLARDRGCHRVLCNPASDEELAQWRAGWDARDAELRNPDHVEADATTATLD